MALRFAKLTAIAAVLLGIAAIPALMTMPSLLLCRLRPPFEECVVGALSGTSYIQGDSPAALTWVLTSFVLAPLASVLGVWLVGRGHLGRGRIIAALSIVPNLMLFAGTYAVMPFHPIVFALTLGTLVALLVSEAPTWQAPQRVFERGAVALIVLTVALGIWLIYALKPQYPLDAPPPAAATTATLTASPIASPTAARVPADVANGSLASYARNTGRSEVAICLYVDPSTGLDAGAARASVQTSVDTLVRQGYTVLGARPVVLCPQAPVFIRTSTVHPKNSGSGQPVGTAARVSTPSPILLFVAVTTPSRITFIFGGLTTRRGAEEVTCTGDNCGEVTGSIYSDPTAFASAVERENLILGGLGLDGPGK